MYSTHLATLKWSSRIILGFIFSLPEQQREKKSPLQTNPKFPWRRRNPNWPPLDWPRQGAFAADRPSPVRGFDSAAQFGADPWSDRIRRPVLPSVWWFWARFGGRIDAPTQCFFVVSLGLHSTFAAICGLCGRDEATDLGVGFCV